MKRLIISIIALVALVTGARADGATAYSVWCADNTTLYFLGSETSLAAGDSFTPEGESEAVTITNVWSGNQVVARGTYNALWYNTVKGSLTKAVFEPSFKQFKPTGLASWFYDCTKLTTVEGADNLDTSEAVSMAFMFRGCSSLTSLDASSWNTSKVTAMNVVFFGCSSLETLDLSGFDTRNVGNMANLFNGCTKLKTLTLGTGLEDYE